MWQRRFELERCLINGDGFGSLLVACLCCYSRIEHERGRTDFARLIGSVAMEALKLQCFQKYGV